jgi:hypothetical protein
MESANPWLPLRIVTDSYRLCHGLTESGSPELTPPGRLQPPKPCAPGSRFTLARPPKAPEDPFCCRRRRRRDLMASDNTDASTEQPGCRRLPPDADCHRNRKGRIYTNRASGSFNASLRDAYKSSVFNELPLPSSALFVLT